MNVFVTTDRARMNVELVHAFLSQDSYWAKNVPRDVVERAMANSMCFAAFDGEEQLGFARVITDYATFAYIADVFVVPSRRGRGIGKRLMEAIGAHPELQGFRRWMLATRDAHGLYAQFGFQPLDAPERIMMKLLRDPYGR